MLGVPKGRIVTRGVKGGVNRMRGNETIRVLFQICLDHGINLFGGVPGLQIIPYTD
jgi:hypothetical protein